MHYMVPNIEMEKKENDTPLKSLPSNIKRIIKYGDL